MRRFPALDRAIDCLVGPVRRLRLRDGPSRRYRGMLLAGLGQSDFLGIGRHFLVGSFLDEFFSVGRWLRKSPVPRRVELDPPSARTSLRSRLRYFVAGRTF